MNLKQLLMLLGLVRPEKILYIGGSDVLPPPLPPEEERTLIARLAEGDEQARQTLVERNLRLVVYIARRFENTGVNIEDLISIGTIGLIKAVGTFRADRNIKLATYSSRCIENEILMHFRTGKKQSNDIYLGDALDVDKDGNPLTVEDTISSPVDLAEDLEKKIQWEKVSRIIEKMPNGREKEIIVLRYGLNNKKPLTQREIAQRLKISRSYVSRIEKKVLTDIKNEID